jgi:hypothetical protein
MSFIKQIGQNPEISRIVKTAESGFGTRPEEKGSDGLRTIIYWPKKTNAKRTKNPTLVRKERETFDSGESMECH